MAKKKVNSGRPTKYKPEYSEQARAMAEEGLTDKQIAKLFGVTKQTLGNSKHMFPQFFASLKAGKKLADEQVVKSLYHRALGYSAPETHITNHKGKITKTELVKHYPPDPTSLIFWLKNRDPKNWRDKHDHHLDGDLVVNLKLGEDK